LIVVAGVLALAAGVAAARIHKVVVVRGSTFQLTAWSQHEEICFRLKSGKSSAQQCAEKLVLLRGRVNFVEFLNAKRTAAYVGGAARKRVVRVVATFADGSKLTMKTVRSRRYRGRFRRQVKFWAGRHAGSSQLRSIVGKNSRGSTVEQVEVPAPPSAAPPPPPPRPPCGCGPPRAASICPVAERPICQ
jgi:hypothetical protein